MKKIVLRKIGNFYYAFDDDAIIITYFFPYKYSNYKCGFPTSSLDKVIKTIEFENISYEIIDEEIRIYKGKDENYDRVFSKAKIKRDLESEKEQIISTIDNLSIEELKNIGKAIDKELNS